MNNLKNIYYNIGELVTLKGANKLRQGREMSEFEIIKNAYFIELDGKVIEVGNNDDYLLHEDANMINVLGRLVTPGLIDSHTHLVHAGSREHELKQKLEGVSYLDILKNGGGILSTVSDTREASFEELYDKSKSSLDIMLEYGVTTVEAKSGYGLNMETELKQLEVAKKLSLDHDVHIVCTFMGAHAIPFEYKTDRNGFIELVNKIAIEVKKRNLAEFVDVFCEVGVFSKAESEVILKHALDLGFKIKIHADEIASIGGVTLAAELKASSAEHLMATSVEDMKLLSESKTVLTILPSTSFNLDKGYARTRLMIDNNCGLAIASDYNPGSSPSENLQLAMQIAAIKTKMTPKEVITAVTINAAVSLGLNDTKGSLELGKDADFVIFDCTNLDYLIYHFGINHVKDVYIKGKQVVQNQRVIRSENEISR
jgi:imidazolonepropionase